MLLLVTLSVVCLSNEGSEEMETSLKKGNSKIVDTSYFYKNSKRLGEEFLAKNKVKPGIVTLPNGVQYKIITPGKGRKPLMNDIVKVHYTGKLINDSIFIYTHGIFYDEFKVEDLPLKGLAEVLTLMTEGATWEVCIPQELGYRDKRIDKLCTVPPFSVLVFEINLMSVHTDDKNQKNPKSWGLEE